VIRLFNVYYPVRTLVLLVGEALIVGCSFILGTFWNTDNALLFKNALFIEGGYVRILVLTAIVLLLSHGFDLYDSSQLGAKLDQAFRLLFVLGLVALVLAGVVKLFPGFLPGSNSALLGVAEQASPEATRSLRTCVSGGAALPVQVLADFEKAFGCTVLEGYGLSESSPAAAFNHPHRERKVGSIGTPIEGVQMRVVDLNGAEVPQGHTGEIQIRGHNVMKGYWNLPDATKATISPDGWLATGDVGRVDEDGYFYIVDRTKDLIIRGGYNVYPREIEEVLYEHPDVAEAAVIGVPHDSLGEEVGAAVALKEGAKVHPDELRDYVKERVAAYKYPRQVWLVDALPKGPTGKVQKRDITIPTTESTR